ncbi:DUF3073 domain-containing protein [Corynebacterium kalidii]|jgi:hypothetical protein|uniref:DUF3073 domain-containing protein n=1 Tax=Corynebacterium kalidii TaxID=2931982 RepID=A0A9X2AZT4_9CORY|nr:DUF3073 domain-containing protein [Corynebacterium kalidii]MCJ7859138.1 DUF3073 domain-containing protein [Corynebacterium kalidii]
MGRGRAKAKQTKVARQLKYSSPDMDLESLQRELSTESGHSTEDDYEEWEDWSAEEDEGR